MTMEFCKQNIPLSGIRMTRRYVRMNGKKYDEKCIGKWAICFFLPSFLWENYTQKNTIHIQRNRNYTFFPQGFPAELTSHTRPPALAVSFANYDYCSLGAFIRVAYFPRCECQERRWLYLNLRVCVSGLSAVHIVFVSFSAHYSRAPTRSFPLRERCVCARARY
jgi:hypothetical protein